MGEDDYSWLLEALGQGDTSWLDTLGDATGGQGGSWIDTLGDMTGGQGGTQWIDTLGDMTGGQGGNIDWGRLATGGGSGGGGSPYDKVGSDWATGTPGAGVSNTGGGGGGGGYSLADILKGLGVGNTGGGLDIGKLLGVLAPIGAGLYTQNRVDKATDQQLAAIKEAQQGLSANSAQNNALYAPYRDVGGQALQRLNTAPRSNMAGNFRPLGSGRGLSLSNVMLGR